MRSFNKLNADLIVQNEKLGFTQGNKTFEMTIGSLRIPDELPIVEEKEQNKSRHLIISNETSNRPKPTGLQQQQFWKKESSDESLESFTINDSPEKPDIEFINETSEQSIALS